MITDSSKFIAYVARIFGVLALISACLLIVYLLAGCGKAGYPRPQDESRAFEWGEVNAKMVGKCIAFTGNFTGRYEYFDGVRLEIDSLSGPEECPGCPFVPDEVTEIPPRESGFNPEEGSIAFSYCPKVAKAYRWRLAGISIDSRLPHAVMVDRLLVVEP